MRWIDIILPVPGSNPEFAARIAEIEAWLPGLEKIQARDGLDALTVVEHMAEVGRALFQATAAALPGVFNPDGERPGLTCPALDRDDHDRLVGFHLIADPGLQALPWAWLHNGMGFLLQNHPICVGGHRSHPGRHGQRPWMRRLIRSQYMLGPDGRQDLPAQLEPRQTALPELLFVPGHADRRIRSLIFREAEAISEALAGGSLGLPLASMTVPDGAVTPGDLALKSLTFQALHYAGPTSEAAQYDASESEYWMNRLIEEAAAAPDEQFDEALGFEGEVLGVDPITSLLDDISERYETAPAGAARLGAEAGGSNIPAARGRSGGGSWLLDDGPIDPESFEQAGGMPPLVFSNSYCALPELGTRFGLAGSSVFIGPLAPLFSRPARSFAGHCYAALAEGWCAGAAVWKAAAACRQELGADHPAWLSYGIQGYGALALQYL